MYFFKSILIVLILLMISCNKQDVREKIIYNILTNNYLFLDSLQKYNSDIKDSNSLQKVIKFYKIEFSKLNNGYKILNNIDGKEESTNIIRSSYWVGDNESKCIFRFDFIKISNNWKLTNIIVCNGEFK